MKRSEWIDLMLRVATPVWAHAASGTLKKEMPVECQQGYLEERLPVTHLEAIGRSFCGIAPWLACRPSLAEELERQRVFRQLVLDGLEAISRGDSVDRMNYEKGWQPVVDAAFLALGFLRAPEIWRALSPEAKRHIVSGMHATRYCRVLHCNWLLFSGTIETFLATIGEQWDSMRVDYALRQHEQWYLGAGHYGDGPHFAADYYNSYVIHPMLVEIIDNLSSVTDRWEFMRGDLLNRAEQYAITQERMIHSDGSYPPLGRSLAYRCGAFHLLAQSALREALPDVLLPGQVRRALGAVIKKTLGDPRSYDDNGWLRIGIRGHQPDVGESYISTGSLYLCLAAFLPLGLSEDSEFWSAPEVSITQERIFGSTCPH